MKKERQQSWSEFLDKKKENIIHCRFVLSPDFKGIEEFAIIYVLTIGNRTRQIVRYDASGSEGVHAHQFYKKPPVKKYLNLEKNFDTVKELVKIIRENWVVFISEFQENHYL